jgi:hypothetical protein
MKQGIKPSSRCDALKCMAYCGADTFSCWRAASSRVMDYPINTHVCARNKLRALVPVLAAPRVEALTTRE